MWNNSSSPPVFNCQKSSVSFAISVPCSIIRIFFILPMCIFVFHSSYRRWKPRRSFRAISHSDFFTLNFATMEILAVSGLIVYYGATFCSALEVARAGIVVYGVSFPGEVFIHSLIYLDRYLAVVHPLMYLKRKHSVGMTIRNICVSVVWACCLVYVVMTHRFFPRYTAEMFICLVVTAIIIVSFCSGFILCVLIRPGPSDVEKVDKSKRKAFHTVIISMVVVLVWFVGISLSL
ncbi:hypothetical protein NQD34_013453, partial [Periophthalmus magnuspinnatus]